jgi:hypothetical protein
MWKSILVALIAGLAVQESALGQAVSSADVNIVSVTGALSAQNFTCTAVINNQNDDDSRLTRVIVLMPLQVQKVSGQVSGGPGSCSAAAPVVGGYQEYATCDLGQLPQGPSVRRTVTVTSTRSTAGPNYPHTCSAFIYSAVGDILKTNNYMAAAPVN